MEQLFELKNNKVVFNPVYLMIPEFKELWEQDKSKDKSEALMYFTYIYFLVDYKSPYNNYPEEIKKVNVNKDFMGKEDYKQPQILVKAVSKYSELQDNYAIRILNNSRNSLENIVILINELHQDINQSIKIIKGKGSKKSKGEEMDVIFKNIERIMKITDKLPTQIENIIKLEKDARRFEEEGMKIKGGGTIGMFEVPHDKLNK